MRIIKAVDPDIIRRADFAGHWECPNCMSVVELDDTDTIRSGWGQGTIDLECPVCNQRGTFWRPTVTRNNHATWTSYGVFALVVFLVIVIIFQSGVFA